MPTKQSVFPNGFPQGVTIRGMPILNAYSGNIYWVDSNASANNGQGTERRPYTTIEAALARCTANNGDIIVVKPGHAQTIAAESGTDTTSVTTIGMDLDKAGVAVIGLGQGADRPTITLNTAATADIKLAANNVVLQNFLILAGIDALTGPIEISGDDCALIDVEYRDDDTNNYETTDVVVTASTPLRMLIEGFRFNHPGGSGGTQLQSVIQLNGADHAVIRNCHLVADAGTGVIEDATVSDNLLLEDNLVENTETSPTVGILLQSTSNGSAVRTNVRVASGTTYVTADNDMQWFECFGTGTDATAGEKIGTVLAGDIEGLVGSIDTTTTDSLHGKIGTDTEMADRSIWDMLEGDGFNSWPASAAPGTDVSLAEAIRAIYNAVAADSGADSLAVQMPHGRVVTAIGNVAGSNDDLFTVTGKNLITLMHGEVTSVIATTTSLALVASTAGGAIAASTDIVTNVAGTLYLVTGDPDDGLNGDASSATSQAALARSKTGFHAPIVVNDDHIVQAINGEGTGLIQWWIHYIPLEASASIAST